MAQLWARVGRRGVFHPFGSDLNNLAEYLQAEGVVGVHRWHRNFLSFLGRSLDYTRWGSRKLIHVRVHWADYRAHGKIHALSTPEQITLEACLDD